VVPFEDKDGFWGERAWASPSGEDCYSWFDWETARWNIESAWELLFWKGVVVSWDMDTWPGMSEPFTSDE
ncbi:MAG: hypothetical protein FWD57_05380, partial [Polyangiaceae bacterium]|nr:hypothetical protein [Polyangiaceae bacterium]